ADPNSLYSFPSHLQPLFDDSDLIRSPLSSLLLTLSASSRRLIVVHDHLMSFAGSEAASIPNAESYDFYSPSAAFLCEVELMMMQQTGLDELSSPDFMKFVERRCKDVVPSCGLIINTCREVEGEFLDFLSAREAYFGKPIFAVGPL
ncbi:putative cis-zeatin O-glucosyltransferase, partial [Phalaenopsis equestris]|uniref:putative cis-zeatin O-glucosyltransferase n=1 Tax=Phalaenopsis equestris TaxID=78828 RepID=UPI0009E199A9